MSEGAAKEFKEGVSEEAGKRCRQNCFVRGQIKSRFKHNSKHVSYLNLTFLVP